MTSHEGATAVPSADPTASDALEKLIEAGTATVERELGPAMKNVELTQVELGKELNAICREMEKVTESVGQLGVDKHILNRLAECKESITRTKRTLTTVNARLGRLRKYEDAQRLSRKNIGDGDASSSQEA